MNGLKTETLILGRMATNCYLVMNEENKELLIVDPADDAARISERITALGGVPRAVLLTHGHFDHIGAAEELRSRYGISIYAMDQEEPVLESDRDNLSSMFGHPMTLRADELLQDGQELSLAGCRIRVLHTPGHTRGGACYYFPDGGILFSGDTLFCGSVGRTDFPTGSMSALVRSVKEKLIGLPETTRVYPGHGEATAIGYERDYNPYLA